MSNDIDPAKVGKAEVARKVSSVDFSYQFNAARDFVKVEKSIFLDKTFSFNILLKRVDFPALV